MKLGRGLEHKSYGGVAEGTGIVWSEEEEAQGTSSLSTTTSREIVLRQSLASSPR